ncbi:MLO-like protein 6 [Platanthera guangdongensis]|uniref:MLO-like protein n=1 Tax=Platanthera guangdongensis TaxID=2320717 RepID=A0ABR2N1V9_9ASPA
MALGESLDSTPTWAFASVTALLVTLSVLLERTLHLLSTFVNRTKRKTLNQAVHQLKSGLRNIGFITLLLTVANQPVSKICIQENILNSFLPCIDDTSYTFTVLEAENTCTEGKVPLLSPHGTQQLQMLILLLAVFHLICSLVTLGLGEIMMKRWELWEQETETLDHKLAFDNRKFKLNKDTLFGRRHLKFWSNNDFLLWIVCLLRPFTGSVSKADYFALRRGFIDAHLGRNTKFNFQKFLRRTLDKDFKSLVTISLPLWTYVIFFILFGTRGFYAHFWLPFIPLVVLLAIGAKLEVIITEMCIKGSRERIIISGEVSVIPSDELFWFRKPRWLLHAMQFVLIENSFQLAYFVWEMSTFGFQLCRPSEWVGIAISIGTSLVVQFICAHVALPLYALVSQMGSSMKETVFADQVVAGLKHWHETAKRNLAGKESNAGMPLSPAAKSPSRVSATTVKKKPLPRPAGGLISPSNSRPPQSPRGGRQPELTMSPSFEFPKQMRELVEIQKVTEEMMGANRNTSVGEMSFRMWWAQEIASPMGSGRGSPDR